MGIKTTLVGIQGPGGMTIPKDQILYYATQVPALRREVIRVLAAEGWLEAAGVRPVPWYRRLFRKRAPALPQGT